MNSRRTFFRSMLAVAPAGLIAPALAAPKTDTLELVIDTKTLLPALMASMEERLQEIVRESRPVITQSFSTLAEYKRQGWPEK